MSQVTIQAKVDPESGGITVDIVDAVQSDDATFALFVDQLENCLLLAARAARLEARQTTVVQTRSRRVQ
jgi:hypothetical protein